MLSRLPTRCKHCRIKFTADEKDCAQRIHADCVDPWLTKQLAKQAAAREKKGREEFKERKAKLKRIPDLIKEAQTAFNAYIRERDRDQTCICCGKPLGESAIGGGYDCGHFRSTGSASHLRFDERNAHAQRKFCNRYGAGRVVEYRIGLARRIGLEQVESLEASNTPHKWERDELIAIKALYVAKTKQLKEKAQ